MIAGKYQGIKNYFARKMMAYNRVLDRKSPFTHEVLFDLAKFCRAHTSTFHPDPRVHAQLEGRREVWLRIQEMLNLSPDEIIALHKVKGIKEE